MKYLVIILDSLRYDSADDHSLKNFGPRRKAITNANFTAASFVSMLGCGFWPRWDGDYPRLFHQMPNFVQSIPGKKVMITGMPWLSPTMSYVSSVISQFTDYIFRDTHTILDFSVDFLAEKGDTYNFFLIWTGETHQPYSVGNNKTDWDREKIRHMVSGEEEIDPDYMAYLHQRQREMFRYCSEIINSMDIARETWVLITADHGESFGENGVYGHGNDIHPTQFTVPLWLCKK